MIAELSHYADKASIELGSEAAADQFFPLVYEELRALAHSWFREHPDDAVLQPTALVHEVYLRLAAQEKSAEWQDCLHFRAVAARAMRHVLLDHARHMRAEKRGGGLRRVLLTEVIDPEPSAPEVDMVDLDVALRQLSHLNVRHAVIVELRFFGGQTIVEVARLLDLSERTVELDWKMARTWLLSKLQTADDIQR